MTRAERYEQLKALRDKGMLLREIAAETGVAISTVHDVLSDPTGDAARERKRRAYSFRCEGCGVECKPNGRKELEARSGLCATCFGAQTRRRSRQWIIDSMHEWAHMFGAPPSAIDWNPPFARSHKYCQWKAERHASTGRPWPSVALVQSHYGSWNDGLRAAGFEPLKPTEHWIGHAGMTLMREDMAA